MNRPLRLSAAIASALSLLILPSVLVTAAWFRIQSFASIQGMSLTMRGANLEIGYKRGDFIRYMEGQGELDPKDLDPNYKTNRRLADVSSMFLDQWLNEETIFESTFPMLRKSYATDESHTLTERAKDHFLQFELFLRCSDYCHLFLDDSSFIENVNPDIDLLSSVRISIYTRDTFLIAEGKTNASATRFGGPLSIRNKEGYYDYEDGREILYGEYDGEPNYYPPSDADSKHEGPTTAFLAKHKAGIQAVNAESVKFAYESSVSFESLIYKEGAEGLHCLGVLKPKEDYRLVLTIYLEGWDRDLDDRMADGSLNAAINFLGLLDYQGANE